MTTGGSEGGVQTFLHALEREIAALKDEAQMEREEPPTRYGLSLGEHWLRAKLRAHTRETFDRADSHLVYAAAQDVLRELDRCRGGN